MATTIKPACEQTYFYNVSGCFLEKDHDGAHFGVTFSPQQDKRTPFLISWQQMASEDA